MVMPQDVSAAHAAVIRQAEWPLDKRHLNADAIWHITEGRGVTVAVIDSGVQADHPDLAGQVVPGAGFLGDSHDRGQADVSGDSHGTAIAGIIAGTGAANGGSGMIGLAPKARILPVRVTVHATVEPTALAQGITYAADHHAQVINVSLGMPTPDPVLRRAIDYAIGKDAVIVASAGNNGRNGDPTLYPAAFPGVVDVTGINPAGRFWPVSESGPRTTLAAPATGIYSTNNRGQYVDAEGTSYAAAYVSAAAALVRSAAPHLTAGQTIRRLITTADPHGHRDDNGHDDQYGYGTLNALAALHSTAPPGSTANPLLSANPLGFHSSWHPAIFLAVTGGVLVAGAAAAVRLLRRRRTAPRIGNASTRTASKGDARAKRQGSKSQARKRPAKQKG
ncbi:S8 family serine peptidase [Streptomyces morookaense]|uniref:S8 family serine peptidase n=2 Tax=Streptomyces morookaense TaxID=1970 RepID=A0A7Y7B6Z5_STRMO|nr:S8 family serine peptidase [Streptomyces morookaense]